MKFIFVFIAVVCLNASHVFSVNYEGCMKALELVLRDRTLYADLSESTDPEKLEVLKKHFTENKCASHKICLHNDRTNDTAKLKQKLKPYVQGFITTYEKFKEKPGQSNMHNEIHYGIYETIRNYVIEKKGYSETKADCFEDLIIGTGIIDKAYTSDLFFDSEKLAELIDPLVEEYDTNVANRTPKKALSLMGKAWKFVTTPFAWLGEQLVRSNGV